MTATRCQYQKGALSIGGLCPEEGLCLGSLCLGGSLSTGGLCDRGLCWKGVSVGRGDSPVDRQTPVKTLPSLAICKNVCFKQNISDIAHP